MNNTCTASIRSFVEAIRFALVMLLLLLMWKTVALAQGSAGGSSPIALTGGAPAGSYALSDFDNINLFNGNLNFRLALLNVGGRGAAQHTITLPIEKKWFAEKVPLGQTGEFLWFFNEYVPGAIRPGYGPGVLQGYRSGYFPQTCAVNQEVTFMQTLTKLVFTAPDGTEFELLSANNPGLANVQNCNPTNFNRGRVFKSTDGSGATFISDSNIEDLYLVDAIDPTFPFLPSGYLLLADGSHLRIDGVVRWNRDRNGNQINFSYDEYLRITTITDDLNRQVTINYNVSGNSDEIVYSGFGGAPRIIRVSYSSLSSALRTTQPGDPNPGQTCFGLSGSPYNPNVVSSVWLPDGVRRYRLLYNCFGELARVELPTGGAFEYDHGAGLLNGPSDGTFERPSAQGGTYPQVYRRVLERRVYPDGNTLAGKMVYGRSETYNTSIPVNFTTDQGFVDVDFLDAGGTRLSRWRHYFLGSASPSLNEMPSYNPPALLDGKENKREMFDSNGSTILKRVTNNWENGAPGQGPHITESVTTLIDSNQVARQTFAYDQYNNRTEVYEYDFGSGANYTRRTHTQYLTVNPINGASYDSLNPNSTSPDVNATYHLRNLPKQVSVYDAAGVERQRTSFEYDNYSVDATHFSLTPRSNISGLCAVISSPTTCDNSDPTLYTKRGEFFANVVYERSSGGDSCLTFL